MIKMINRDFTTGFSIFTVDTVAELDKLPNITNKGQDHLHTVPYCCIGSRAFVTSTSENYVLNGDQNKWLKTTGSSGGSGGSDYDIATDEEIRKIFS